MRRLFGKSAVKFPGSTWDLPLILPGWNADAAGGMCGVAVKCIDIRRNTGGEGGLLDSN